MTSSQALEARARAVLAELASDLESRFGWTSIDVELSTLPGDNCLHAAGTVIAPRARLAVVRRLESILPPDWRLDVSRVVSRRSGDFRDLLGVTRLWRTVQKDALATELEPEDGPVEVLAAVGSASLVRSIDATIGWTHDELGARAATPELAPGRGDVGSVVRGLSTWVDAPYLLGGTRRTGVDCSGLVQRALRDALGVIVPRHSTDQLRWSVRATPAEQSAGDLVFVWTDREGPCHVGIIDGASVVHASVSRRRVVSDNLEDFTRGASRIEGVPLSRMVATYASFAGQPSIELAAPEASDEK